MELLCDVGLDRVYAQGRRGNSGECEGIICHDELRPAEHGVAEGHVDAEGAPVDLSGEAALGAKAHAVVLQPIVLDVGVAFVGADGEHHEVAEVTRCCSAEPTEDRVGRAHHVQVDVLGRAGPLDAKLDGEPALQRDGVAELESDASKESVKHDQLAAS